jgi:hypothetical protein
MTIVKVIALLYSMDLKVSFSIYDGFFGSLHWLNSCGRTKALISTQILTDINNGDFPWGIKIAGAKD